MKFLCDEMLGKLARWLRLCGLDVAYLQRLTDDDLLRAALQQERVLLTRDEELAARAGPRALLVRAKEPEEQLTEVVRALGLRLDEAALLSRCSLCNTRIVAMTPETVQQEVPPSVWAAQQAYWRCPTCHKVYWRGTHVERIEARLRALAANPEERSA